MSRFIGVPSRNREGGHGRRFTAANEVTASSTTLSEKSKRAAIKRAQKRAEQIARMASRFEV